MKRIVVCALAMLSVFAFGQAQGQGIFRAYLSLSGNDLSPCTLQQPCRLLPAALNAAKDGGEIWMLDSANYNTGPVTITKSIKILAIPGEMGSIVASGVGPVDALIINAPGKDVTLRNLVVLNLANGVNGINIVDAAAVHLEKSTVHDFSSASGNCLLTTSQNARVYVDDSFFRHCRVAIHAAVAANPGTRPSIVVDNTRIERGFVDIVAAAIGIWQQGCVDISLRNSSVSRQDNGILVDTLVANCSAHMHVASSQLLRNTAAVMVTNNTPNATWESSFVRSQVMHASNGLFSATNSANNSLLTFNIADSHIGYTGANAITASNSSTDNVLGVYFNVSNSQVESVGGNAVDLTSTNASRVRLAFRESSIANVSGRALKTAGSGTGHVRVELIRSNISNVGYIVDHGFGQVNLDGTHMNSAAETFVNNGSSTIFSLGNNWLTNFLNASGFTYITPTVIAPI